jgi:formylglycine-generating enzyme required for sulfatase activity
VRSLAVWALAAVLLSLGCQPAPGPAAGPRTLPARVYTAWPFDAQEAAKRREETAGRLDVPKILTLTLRGDVTMKLALIPAGKFVMGSGEGESPRRDNEGPQRLVTITRPFYMGICEVTQAQYAAVIGGDRSRFRAPDNPAEQVSSDDITRFFLPRLSRQTGRTARLPTEAEWEYACRAGADTKFHFGDDESALGDYAWYGGNSGGKTKPVGGKKPNAWGLYDMYGNVLEWCSDWYADSYAGAKTTDPQGPATGKYRVLRGGGWGAAARYCRSAVRGRNAPFQWNDLTGFRVVIDLE